MNNQTKGLLYEHFVKDKIINELHKNAYLWNQCPENLLIQYGLIKSRNEARLIRREGDLHNHKDIGIDIIQIDSDNDITIVQCKNGYSKGLKLDDVAGIMLRRASKDVTTAIYYTSKLSANVKNVCGLSDRVVMYDYKKHKDAIYNIKNDNNIYFIKLLCDEEPVVKLVFEPYPYQLEATEFSEDHFNENNRGILSMPCGTGKTLVCYLIAKKYKHIVILSPLREFAKQNKERFIEYGYDEKNTLLVDSDGEREIESIKEFINTNESLLISSTYKSMDVLCDCIDLFNKDSTLFIIDEFHNLSKANITDENNDIYKLLITDHKILFVSATPRIYEIEDEEAVRDDGEMLTGNIVYQMTFQDAIANKNITDYKIWVPFVKEDTTELDKELSIYDIETDVKNKCKFLFSAIANNGSRKCIVYCKDTTDMKAQMEAMKTMNDFYSLKIDVMSISCEDNEKTRKTVLKKFANNDNIQLLYSIKILNECIDIPSCDSIYISYAAKNKIITIQRMCRALRTDKNNPFKVANIYLWCSEYDEILETLSSIKEYDCEIIDKIKLNVVDLYEKEQSVKEVREIEESVKELKDYIVGIRQFRSITWEEKLEMLNNIIIETGKLPSLCSKDPKIKQIGLWLSNQKQYYIKSKHLMKNPSIRKIWEDFTTKYSNLFLSNKESWRNRLSDIEGYILKNGKLPSSEDKDPKIKKMGQRISNQKQNYLKSKDIMKNQSIRKEWENFTKKYYLLFLSNEEIWMNTFADVTEYVVKNEKWPSSHSTELKIKSMGQWVSDQKKNFSKSLTIMQNKPIRKEWEDFMIKYPKLFLSNEEIWMNTFANVTEYVVKNGELPSEYNKDLKIKQMGHWLSNQQFKYSKNLLKNAAIKTEWEDFTKKYPKLFLSNEEIWMNNLSQVNDYVLKNGKLPTSQNKDVSIKRLKPWLTNQKTNYVKSQYIMQNKTIRKEWEDFMIKYPKLFLSNEEIWMNNLCDVNDYVDKTGQLPSTINKDPKIKHIGHWLSNQKKNYSNEINIMKIQSIRKIYEDFTNKYKTLFK